jgi:hypothetical protein
MQVSGVDEEAYAAGTHGGGRRRQLEVRVLLRIMAVFSLLWAFIFLCFTDRVVDAPQLSSVARMLANGLGAAHLVLAYMFWYGSRAPAVHRGAIYGAVMLLASKAANDLYGLLVVLPPGQALVSLLDLVVSIALLVSVLESLPRTLAAPRS